MNILFEGKLKMNFQILSEPASTRRLKANLSLAIDETILARKITGLEEQLYKVQFQPEQHNRKAYLSQELKRLNIKLAEIRQSAIDFE